MRTLRHNKGQTLIETAFVLIILMLISLGLVEFARAWYVKSSMKNAARQGARVAVVTPAANITTSFTCDTATACPNGDPVIYAVCCQPGVPKKDGGTDVEIHCYAEDGSGEKSCGSITTGDELEVITFADFNFIIGGTAPFWEWSNQRFTADATMRYE